MKKDLSFREEWKFIGEGPYCERERMKHSEVMTRLLPRAATTNTSELGTELAWCTILLSTILLPTVVLTISTGSTIGSLTATAGATCSHLRLIEPVPPIVTHGPALHTIKWSNGLPL